MDTERKNFESRLKERLSLPKAILSQLRDTYLFNSMIDQAIQDIDELLKRGEEE